MITVPLMSLGGLVGEPCWCQLWHKVVSEESRDAVHGKTEKLSTGQLFGSGGSGSFSSQKQMAELAQAMARALCLPYSVFFFFFPQS